MSETVSNAGGRRLEEIRQKVAAAMSHEAQTGMLRGQLAMMFGAPAGYVPNPQVDQVTTLVRGYVEQVPTILDRLQESTGDAALGPSVRSVLSAAERCFLASPFIPDNSGILGILDNAYLVYQLCFLSDPQGMPVPLTQAHQFVRNMLGAPLAIYLDQVAASALQAEQQLQTSGPPDSPGATPAAETRPRPRRGVTEETAAPPAPYVWNGADKPGDLDATFGNRGRVTAEGLGKVHGAALQKNGKVVVVGTTTGEGLATSQFSIARFHADGSIDDAFGNGGKVIVPFGSGGGQAYAAAIQDDGRIVVVGNVNGLGVVRLNPDGSLDETFGEAGRVITTFPQREIQIAYAVLIQPDGKIMVAGQVGLMDQDIALVRHNPDGSLDRSFGSSMTGTVLVDFTGGFDTATAICLQPDGRILVAGRTAAAGAKLGNFGLMRFTTLGLLDETFGNGGKVTTDFSQDRRFTDDSANAMALLTDGRILLAGACGDDFSRDAALARYNGDGSLDTTFGSDGTGRVVTDFGTDYDKVGLGAQQFDEVTSMALQPDGKYLIAGSTSSAAGGTTRDFLVARYTADGVLDVTFGKDGVVTTDFGGAHDSARALLLQPDGRIIAAGYTGDLNRSSYALARYVNPNTESPGSEAPRPVDVGAGESPDVAGPSALDSAFGDAGLVITSFGGHPATAHALCLQPDGRILMAGSCGDPAEDKPFDVAIARFEPDGRLDESFADKGRGLIDILGADDTAQALVVQDDGKILIAGEVLNLESNTLDFMLLRLNADGTIDTGFNGSGVVVADVLGGTDDAAYAVAIQPDGKIVVAGYTTEPLKESPDKGDPAVGEELRSECFAVARYLENGLLDSEFGVGGFVITPFAGDLARAYAVGVQSDGHLLAAGFARRAPTDHACDLALARYRPDGSLDDSFGSGGRVLIDMEGTDDTARAMVVLPDGKIVVAGSAADKAAGRNHFLIARMHPDGSLDRTFGGTGVVMPTAFEGSAQAVAVRADGTVLAAGYERVSQPAEGGEPADQEQFALAAFKPDGSADEAVGADGLMRVSLGGTSDDVKAISLQADGRILLAGTRRTPETSDFALVRLVIVNPATE